jgi:hypothetical protein
MTAELFDRLLYTDCMPGTGRGAGGGFQVQAQSAEVDSAQSALAAGWLIYEVQIPWLNQRRPVGDFPLGFAHAADESYGTAQGRYVGKEAAGGRDGNHLTDCLLTTDPDLYGPIRPAQLWRSGLWRALPWDGKDCPQFDAAGLQPGPLTVDAVADWARAVPERGPILARLLSVLEEPGQRVVIVADDPEEATTWIAAATLLLPSRQALAVSFKVFSSTPLDAKHRVVAAPAALFPRIAPGLVSQRFVLDAQTCAADEAETSERAAFFAGRFTAKGEDAYDVVDAVELTDSLGGGRDAMLTAWALTRPEEPRPAPEALAGWLSGASAELLSEHGQAVAAMVLESVPSGSSLRWLDAAVRDQRLDLDPGTVRAQLLTAELAEIRDGRDVPVQEVLPAASLDAAAGRDTQSELSSALLLSADRKTDLLLSLARRHGITPELALPLRQRLYDFACSWLDHPGSYHPDEWALRTAILDFAHDELRSRLGAAGPAAIETAVRRLNRYFGDRADLSDRLDCQIQASLIASRDRARRLSRLRQLIALVPELAQSASRRQAATAADELQRALIEWDAVDGDVAVALLTGLPDEVSVEPEIAERAAEQLTEMSEKPSRELLDLLASLYKRGKAPASGRLAKVREEDSAVQAFTARAVESKVLTDNRYFKNTVQALSKVDPAVVKARLDDVLTACLQSPHPELGALVLASLKSGLPRLLVERWAATLGTRDVILDGVWCVNSLHSEYLPQKAVDQLAAAVRDYVQTLSDRDYSDWYADVKGQLWPDLQAVWDWVLVQEAPRQRRGLWLKWDGDR